MKLVETESEYHIQGEVECSACDGTGLYQGMAEHNGAAVVCYKCNGTGKCSVKLTYQKFRGRKIREGIERVYDASHGYFISAEDATNDEGTTFPFSQWGCDYGDWLNGAEPIPMRGLICPYLHTNQKLQSEDVNGLYETRCSKNTHCGQLISNCPLWPEKEKCWEIFEEAQDE
uniref:Uncharacterized protein n=1 Tax=viral metagenome TaxID=1070528 RepID=A0A6M3LT73_9ZZZZ